MTFEKVRPRKVTAIAAEQVVEALPADAHPADSPRGIAHHQGVGRNVADDNAAGTDEDDFGLWIAIAEDRVGGGFFQPAAIESSHRLVQVFDRLGRLGQGPGVTQQVFGDRRCARPGCLRIG